VKNRVQENWTLGINHGLLWEEWERVDKLKK
jgi:hypothetical protein